MNRFVSPYIGALEARILCETFWGSDSFGIDLINSIRGQSMTMNYSYSPESCCRSQHHVLGFIVYRYGDSWPGCHNKLNIWTDMFRKMLSCSADYLSWAFFHPQLFAGSSSLAAPSISPFIQMLMTRRFSCFNNIYTIPIQALSVFWEVIK